MKKNGFLISLLSLIGVVAIVVALFVPAWNLVIANEVINDYGFFQDWGATLIGQLPDLNTTWAVLAMVSTLIALVALALFALIALLQHFKVIKGWGGLMKLLAWISVLAFIAILAFGLVFTISSDSSVSIGNSSIVNSMKFGAGYWLSLIGTGIGAFFALISTGSK